MTIATKRTAPVTLTFRRRRRHSEQSGAAARALPRRHRPCRLARPRTDHRKGVHCQRLGQYVAQRHLPLRALSFDDPRGDGHSARARDRALRRRQRPRDRNRRPATSSSCRPAPVTSSSRRRQELVVIGAYPPTGKYDLCRGSKAEHDKALGSIPNVPAPDTDPVFGAERTADRTVAGMIPDWLSFWDKPHSIYVNARHKDVHYRLIADEIAARCRHGEARVLDYGCGEALHADMSRRRPASCCCATARPACAPLLPTRFAGDCENSRAFAATTSTTARRIASISSCCIRSRNISRRSKLESLLVVVPPALETSGGVLLRERRHPAATSRLRPTLPHCCGSPPRTDFCSPRWPASRARCFPITGGCARASASPITARRR